MLIDNKIKIDFLEKLLNKNSDLKKQFFTYANEQIINRQEIVKHDFNLNEIYQEFNDLDLEKRYLDSYEDRGYYDCYDFEEDNSDLADGILSEIFDKYINEVSELFNSGKYSDGLNYMMEISKIVLNPPEIYDNYYIFSEDINWYINEYIKSKIEDLTHQFNSYVISSNDKKNLIDIFIDKLKQNNSSKSLEYFTKSFYEFFKQLLDNSQLCDYFYRKLETEDLLNLQTAHFTLHIANINNDNNLFVTTATKYMLEDKTIAMLLLKRYKKYNVMDEVIEKGKVFFNLWADYFDEYLTENLDIKQAKELYIEVLKSFVKRKYSFSKYKILSELIQGKQKDDFINQLTYSKEFYIQVLEYEKKYKEILEFVQKSSSTHRLAEYIKPIVSIYPNECFDIVKEKSLDILQNSKSRQNYKMIVQWLQIIKAGTLDKNMLNDFITKSLYSHTPRLPALRDELQKGQLL